MTNDIGTNMKQQAEATTDIADLREMSLDEIDATAGAGIISWLKSIFSGPGDRRRPTDRDY